MFPTLPRLLPRLTFYTRSSCALCHNTRQTLSDAWDRGARFEYKEIDVMIPENYGKWSVWEFDVPVVEVFRDLGEGEKGQGERGDSQALPEEQPVWRKMHRVEVEEVVEAVRRAEKAE
ncbi:hypothetical protein EX30DRAFT_342870 [Ascodesmis nigricans]|uniref:Glutaredoxin-like protein n=1 Tax=Ascodesmis nigricans TaxID=341454 RepID=A0A4V3SI59_9PEZI|nr:hypothetical protein EX30DRAFT_342870 [Ascodesmis nigricans]